MKTVAHASHVPLSLRLMRLEENLETIDRRERGSRDIFYCVASRTSRACFLFLFLLLFLFFPFFPFFFFLFKKRSIRLSADNGLRNVTWRFPGDVSSLRACFLSFCAPSGFDAFYARSLSRPRVSKMDRVCLDPFALFSTRNDDGSIAFQRVHEFVFEEF